MLTSSTHTPVVQVSEIKTNSNNVNQNGNQWIEYYITENDFNEYRYALKDLKLYLKYSEKNKLDRLKIDQGHLRKINQVAQESLTQNVQANIEATLKNSVSLINDLHHRMQTHPENIKSQIMDGSCIRLAAKLHDESVQAMQDWNTLCQQSQVFAHLAIHSASLDGNFNTINPQLLNQTAQEMSLVKYQQLLEKHPHLKPHNTQDLYPTGHKRCAIDTITNPDDIRRVQHNMYNNLKQRRGVEFAVVGSTIGPVYQDAFWTRMREVVKIADKEFTYIKVMANQVLSHPQSIAGSVMLAVKIDENGQMQIPLILNYRYQTDTLGFETPRGGLQNNDPKQTAISEALEEAGLVLDNVESLGIVDPDAGMLGQKNAFFISKVIGHKDPKREKTEAIDGPFYFTFDQIMEGIAKQELTIQTSQGPKTYPFTDALTYNAILLAIAQGKI